MKTFWYLFACLKIALLAGLLNAKSSGQTKAQAHKKAAVHLTNIDRLNFMQDILFQNMKWGKPHEAIEAEKKGTEWITQAEFLKNIISRLHLYPSSSTAFITWIGNVIGLTLPGKVIERLDFEEAKQNVSLNLTHIVINEVDIESGKETGIIPSSETTFRLTFPHLTFNASFNYSFKDGEKGKLHVGNGSLLVQNLWLGYKIKTSKGRIPANKVKGECLEADFDYKKIYGIFSDPLAQKEFDALFKRRKVVDMIVKFTMKRELNKFFKETDLRYLVTHDSGEFYKVVVGIPHPLVFTKTKLPAPDHFIIDTLIHQVVINNHTKSLVTGLFNVNMSKPLLNDSFSSYTTSMDFYNKLIKMQYLSNNFNISFNQKLLDKIKFDMLSMNTSLLTEFFPSIVQEGGADRGVFFQFTLPTYNTKENFIRASGGTLGTFISLTWDVWVDSDSQHYYDSTLEECIEKNTCKNVVTAVLDFSLQLPWQFTESKNLVVAYVDFDITNLVIKNGKLSAEVLKSKLNNFLSLSLPKLFSPLPTQFIFGDTQPSLDSLDDQRIVYSWKINPSTLKENSIEETAAEK